MEGHAKGNPRSCLCGRGAAEEAPLEIFTYAWTASDTIQHRHPLQRPLLPLFPAS